MSKSLWLIFDYCLCNLLSKTEANVNVHLNQEDYELKEATKLSRAAEMIISIWVQH